MTICTAFLVQVKPSSGTAVVHRNINEHPVKVELDVLCWLGLLTVQSQLYPTLPHAAYPRSAMPMTPVANPLRP